MDTYENTGWQRPEEDADDQNDQTAAPIVPGGGIHQTCGADAEHPAQPGEGSTQTGGEEEHPADQHQYKGKGDADSRRNLLQNALEDKLMVGNRFAFTVNKANVNYIQ